MEWLEPAVVELAGSMRIFEAIPYLMERLGDEDLVLSDATATALMKIGNDAVVEAIADECWDETNDFQGSAADVLERIHSELCLQSCLEFLESDMELDTAIMLGYALLAHFDSAAIEPVRQMVLGDDDDLTPDQRDLRYRLTAVATIMQASFPEYEAWYHEALATRWGWHDYTSGRLSETYEGNFASLEKYSQVPQSDDVDDENDYWEDGLLDAEDDDYEEQVLPPTTIRREDRVERNEPCPCGSGKKYKKCCIVNQAAFDSDEHHAEAMGQLRMFDPEPKYPIGTLAMYGPDDQRTTKLVAAVIRREGAEPALERWVGNNVLHNNKVQRQIREFFARHGVKSGIGTEANIGCPHEEVLDFPEGEDCPFCPYWSGKQGSNRRE